MGLGLAGAISGFGNALNQGLQTMNSGIVQMGLHDADRAFQTEKLKLQMSHAERLQKEKMAGDRENNLAVIDATNKNTIALEGVKHGHAKELQEDQEKHADSRLDKQLGSHEKLVFEQLKVTTSIHDKDRNMLEKRYKDHTSIEQQRLNLDKNKTSLVPTDDGRLALITPDGKAHGYLTDGAGKEIRSPKDLPESAKVELTSVLEEMKGLERDKIRNGGMWTDEQNTAYENQMKAYRKQYNEVLQRHGLKTAEQSAPPPVVIPDEFKNLGASPTPGPQSSAAPAQTPPGITKSEGLTGAIKGLVPGLGMIGNYLSK